MAMREGSESDQATVTSTRWGRQDMVVLVCGGVALGVAVYLSAQALIAGAVPPGCGAGSGCDQVLTSKYARLFGMPVSLLAVLAYAGLLGSWFVARRRGVGWGWVLFFAMAVILSAAWFIFLQLAVLRAVCTYCMADHTFGLIAATVALYTAVGRTSSGAATRLTASIAALVLVVAMAGVQQFSQPPLLVSLFGGAIALPMAEVPHVGDLQAERKLFVMYDYACSHCRDAHDLVLKEQAERDDLLVGLLPISIWPECNPAFRNTADRFRESCELAEIALAVYQVEPEAFHAFDAWMFDWEGRARTAAEARAHAEQMVGAEALQAALASGAPRRTLQGNVALFQATGADRVPVLLVGTDPTHRVFGAIPEFDPIDKLFDAKPPAE